MNYISEQRNKFWFLFHVIVKYPKLEITHFFILANLKKRLILLIPDSAQLKEDGVKISAQFLRFTTEGWWLSTILSGVPSSMEIINLYQGMIDGSASKPALRQDTSYMAEKTCHDIATY